MYATGGNRGAEIFARGRATWTPRPPCSPSTTAPSRWCPTPATTARGHDVRLELHGSADSIAVGLEDRLPLRSVEPGATFPAGPPHTFFMDRFADAFRAELAAFIEVVAGRRSSPCTVADALETALVAEACHLLPHRAPARTRRRGPPLSTSHAGLLSGGRAAQSGGAGTLKGVTTWMVEGQGAGRCRQRALRLHDHLAGLAAGPGRGRGAAPRTAGRRAAAAGCRRPGRGRRRRAQRRPTASKAPTVASVAAAAYGVDRAQLPGRGPARREHQVALHAVQALARRSTSTSARAGCAVRMAARKPISRSSSPRNDAAARGHQHVAGPVAEPLARAGTPRWRRPPGCPCRRTPAGRWPGRSVTSVTTGMPARPSRCTAAMTSGASGALRTTPCEPRRPTRSSVATSSATGPDSRKVEARAHDRRRAATAAPPPARSAPPRRTAAAPARRRRP